MWNYISRNRCVFLRYVPKGQFQQKNYPFYMYNLDILDLFAVVYHNIPFPAVGAFHLITERKLRRTFVLRDICMNISSW